MNKYQTVTINTLYIGLGTAGSKLIYLLMLPLFTRWLTVDEYGATDTITIYTDVLMSILFLNIADSIFVYPKLAESGEEKRGYFSSGMFFIGVMGVLGALLFWGLDFVVPSSRIGSVFFKYKWLIWGILVTRFLQKYVQGFAKSLDLLKVYSATGVVMTGMIALFSFLLIPRWKVDGYVYAIILAQVVATFYSFFSIRAYSFLSMKAVDWKSLKALLLYGAPLVPNSIMWWLINGFNRPVMEQYLGLAAVGIYAVANRISGIINSASEIFGLAWGNSVLGEYGKDGFERFFNNYLKMMASICFIGCAFLVVFAKEIVFAFSTSAYLGAANYIPFLALGLCFSCLSSSLGGIFAAVKESKYFLYASLGGGLASVCSLMVLMPWLGLYGVAFSMTLSFFVIFVIRWLLANKYVLVRNKCFFLVLLILLALIYINTIVVVSCWKYMVDAIILVGFAYFMRHDIRKVCVVLAMKW